MKNTAQNLANNEHLTAMLYLFIIIIITGIHPSTIPIKLCHLSLPSIYTFKKMPTT